MVDIEKNILQLKKDIEESESLFCRGKNSVMLIAVSKTHSVEKIKEAATNDEISEQLSEKSKDLFEELFGEAS